MASSKKFLKLSIIIVLAIFLLSSALVSVMYFAGPKNIDPETGELITGENIISTGVDSMGL